MPAISRIRFTNVVYENGGKRYNDDIFHFDGYNGAILIENGGGKTVFVQTAIQAILPHHEMADRKIRETLSLEGSPCHIAIEWIINERPRRYLLTAVTLFLSNNKLDSYKYIYEYSYNDDHNIESIPFIRENQKGQKRPSSKGEMNDYYQYMTGQYMDAKMFKTIRDFHSYLEENYQIVPAEWRNIALINSAEGGVEAFFEECKTTTQLVDKLLIPTVEEAVSENGTKDFVDSFEKQRERFKRHKQLRERIEESKQIRNEINKYVDIFSKYHNSYENYNDKRSFANTLYKYTENEEKNIGIELENIKRAIKETEELEAILEKKKASYELAVIKKELEDKRRLLENSKEEFIYILNKYNDMNEEKTNLEIAKLKKDIKDSIERMAIYELQLKKYEEDTDINDIRMKLEENSSKLRGYYLTKEKGLENEQILYEGQQRNYSRDLKQIEDKLKKQLKEKENLSGNINQIYGIITQIQRSLQSILNKLFNISQNDDMKQKITEWSKRVSQLHRESADNNEEISNLNNEKIELNTDLSDKRTKLRELENKSTSISEKINAIKKNHTSLLTRVKELNTMWYTLDSLYTRQDSIISYLNNKIINLNDERENILLNERIASRFADYYRDSTYFSPEPLLEERVDSWKSQLAYVELGIKYVERAAKNLNKGEREFFKTYPYWPLSVIVSDKDILKLKEKIKSIRDKIIHPIFILGESEALEILQGKESVNDYTVFPVHWKDNMNKEVFHKWKEELLDKVSKINRERKEKEDEIERFKIIKTELNRFYSEYTYKEYQSLKSDQRDLKDKTYSIINKIRNMEDRIIEIDNNINVLSKKLQDNSDEINNLNGWINLATEYIKEEREKEKNILLKKELEEKEEIILYDLEKTEKEKKRIQETLLCLKEKIDENKTNINRLRDEESYKEVKNSDPIYSTTSKDVLEDERKNLKNILYEKQEDIEIIENNIKREKTTKEKSERALERKRKEIEYDIDEELEFPIYGDERIDDLINDINNIKPEKARLEKEFAISQKEFDDKQKEYDIRESDFYKSYDEIIIFSDSLYKVNLDIEREFKKVKEKKKQNKKEEDRLKKEETDINSILNKFNIENGKHSFKSDNANDIKLDSDTKMDYPYNRDKYLENLSEDLENLKMTLENHSKKVDRQREGFIVFCNNEIKDPRLKERTISGVREKNNYEDIINWQNRMTDNISKTIQIAEDDMREHDKDLQQFIQHLYTYLSRITEELRIIPKNTRIKVEDKWKEIYRFDIPEWNEQEGKEELRRHIDWMINQLENSDFKNEDGSENYTAIRKEIEKWLNSKQLLKIVLKNNIIKISCRKVTNDGKISSAPTTWERSNKWSGGEKWSKNMTLFLGILNYLAEKRQRNISGQMVRRTVIVDNPFGKASSDHVLDPIFFIAEKLGFQIIALTAHSEGKYIRNYFPVVYSCKLRESVTGNSLIIDKEKEIQYAFFKDNAPQALTRLGEQEQMSLLEIN